MDVKKGSSKSKELAYFSLVRPLMEYGGDPYHKYQVELLEKVQKRAEKLVLKGTEYGYEENGKIMVGRAF